jgi:hypothetical protein
MFGFIRRMVSRVLGLVSEDQHKKELEVLERQHMNEMEVLKRDLGITSTDDEGLPLTAIDEFGVERDLGKPFLVRAAEAAVTIEVDGKQVTKEAPEPKKFILELTTHRLLEATTIASELRQDNRGWIIASQDRLKQFEWPWDKQREMIVRSHEEGQKGIGKSIKNNTTNFAMGDGATIAYMDPEKSDDFNRKITKRLQRFWKRNNLDVTQFSLSDAIVDRGEVFAKGFYPKDPTDPIRLEFIDAIQIFDYARNKETKEVTKFFRRSDSGGMALPEEIPIGGTDEYTFFTWKFNVTENMARGRSDLYATLFWIKLYKDFLNGRSRLNRFRSSVAWHKKVDGTSGEVSAARTKIAKPFPPGVVLITDAKITYEALKTNIDAGDVKDDADQFREMIAGTVQIPVFWLFGTSERTTRATAQTMGRVPRRKFRRRQKDIRIMLHAFAWADLQWAYKQEIDPLTREMKVGNATIYEGYVVITLPPIDTENAEDIERRSRAANNLKAAGVGSDRALYNIAGIDYEQDAPLKKKQEEQRKAAEERALVDAITKEREEREDEERKKKAEEQVRIGPKGGIIKAPEEGEVTVGPRGGVRIKK